VPLSQSFIYPGSHVASHVSYSDLLGYVMLKHCFGGIEPTGALGLWLEEVFH